MKQLTKEQAIEIAKGGEWKYWTDEEVVKFQLYQKILCMDLHRFHAAIENVLGRPVFMREFAYRQNLIDEYEGERPAPTFEEIVELIPEEKRFVIGL